MYKYLLLLSFMSQTAFGFTQDDMMHFAAHTGVSYGLQTVFYGIGTRWLDMPPVYAEVTAAVFTLAIGFAYKAGQDLPNDTGRAMLYNTVGVMGAVGTHLTFRF